MVLVLFYNSGEYRTSEDLLWYQVSYMRLQ